MRKHYWILIVMSLSLMSLPSAALAIEKKDYETVQRIAKAYLAETPGDNNYIKPEAVLDRIYSGDDSFILLDVRGENAYKAWHLPKAINIPYRQVADPDKIDVLPKDKDIIVYCNSGHEESKVVAILGMLGYRAKGLKWGLLGWHYVPSTSKALKAISVGLTDDYPIER